MDNQNQFSQGEGTVLDSKNIPSVPTSVSSDKEVVSAASKSRGSNVVSAVIGSGVGATAGAAAGAVLTGMRSADPVVVDNADDAAVVVEETVEETVETVDTATTTAAAATNSFAGHVAVAHGVNDNMSFAQAFSTARAEVGSGGVFHWHGQSYNTFTAEEWNAMSSEQRSDFGHAALATGSAPAYSPSHNHSNTSVHTVDTTATTDDSDVEILSVSHDDESGANFAYMTVDDNDVVLIDVDGDMAFDGLVFDANQDGTITEDEVYDIQDAGLSVDSIGGFTDGAPTDYYVDNNEIDYTNDATV